MNGEKSTVNTDLCKASPSDNIPLNKPSNQLFRNFLESYTGKEIPHETTLRESYINDCALIKLCKK